MTKHIVKWTRNPYLFRITMVSRGFPVVNADWIGKYLDTNSDINFQVPAGSVHRRYSCQPNIQIRPSLNMKDKKFELDAFLQILHKKVNI